MVEVKQPKPTDTMADPTYGIGGCLLPGQDYIASGPRHPLLSPHLCVLAHLQATSTKEQYYLKERTFYEAT